MMSKKAIKIICIILAGLMILSTLAVLLQSFAVDGGAMMIPATGDDMSDFIIPIVVICVAVVAIVCAIVIPRVIKKKKN